jgi:cytochrome c biogenesis protein ResB
MTNFEWFLLIVVVIVVPLIVAVIVTLWTIDQANKRKRANRADPQIGVKRKAALSPEDVEARKAERQKRLEEEASGAVPSSPTLPDDVSRETSSLTDDSRNG